LRTHQGAVSHKHLDYYLDEFMFRFNRRQSSSRGKLFYRLAQQAGSGRGPWYLARSKALSAGASNAYFRSLGLPSLFENY